jgi:hypothetical protein
MPLLIARCCRQRRFFKQDLRSLHTRSLPGIRQGGGAALQLGHVPKGDSREPEFKSRSALFSPLVVTVSADFFIAPFPGSSASVQTVAQPNGAADEIWRKASPAVVLIDQEAAQERSENV